MSLNWGALSTSAETRRRFSQLGRVVKSEPIRLVMAVPRKVGGSCSTRPYERMPLSFASRRLFL